MPPLKRARAHDIDERKGTKQRIYAVLPRSNAYVGNFSHAPSAGKNAFFEGDILRVEELERLHRIRAHPLTGNFHSRPGHYSKLHGLAKFREEESDDSLRDPAQRKRILDRIRTTLTEPASASTGADAAGGSAAAAAPYPTSSPSNGNGHVSHGHHTAALFRSAQSRGRTRVGPNGSFHGVSGNDDELIGATTTMLRHLYRMPQAAASAEAAAAAVAMRWAAAAAANGGVGPAGGLQQLQNGQQGWDRDTHNQNPMAQPKHGRGYSSASAAAAAPRNGSFLQQQQQQQQQQHRGGGHGVRASIGPGVSQMLNGGGGGGSSSSGGGGGASSNQHGWESHTVQAQQKMEAFLKDREQLAPDMRPSIVIEKEVTDSYDVDLSEAGKLGRGAYSEVHAATHRATGRPVAIKAIQKKYLFSEAEKAAVEREVSLQQRLVHDHIARLYETYDTPDYLYLVMERAPLGTLEELLFVRGRLYELEAKRFAKQVLEAVVFCHNAGVVHCDIKPANVLIADACAADATLSPKQSGSSSAEAAGKLAADDAAAAAAAIAARKAQIASGEALGVVGAVVKICDFGHVRKVPDVRYYKYTGDINKIPFHLFKHTGTEGFVAPEILDAEPYGKPADLWSVGVMLAVMLVGRMPSVGRASRRQQQRPQLDGPLWRTVSAEGKSLVGGLLELDPDKRLTAAEALRHAWFDQVDLCVTLLPLPGRARSSSGGGGSDHDHPRRRASVAIGELQRAADLGRR